MENRNDYHNQGEAHGHPADERIDSVDGGFGLHCQLCIEAGSSQSAGHQKACAGLAQLYDQVVAGADQRVETAVLLPLDDVNDVVAVGAELDKGYGCSVSHGDRVDHNGSHAGIDHEPDLADGIDHGSADHGIAATQLSVNRNREHGEDQGHHQIYGHDHRGGGGCAQHVGCEIVERGQNQQVQNGIAQHIQGVHNPAAAGKEHLERIQQTNLFLGSFFRLYALASGEIVCQAAQNTEDAHNHGGEQEGSLAGVTGDEEALGCQTNRDNLLSAPCATKF